MSSRNDLQMIRRLVEWYERQKRDLPWRKDVHPYKTWISEIMLQQTQVITVIDYFNRWIKKFPTVEKLANANESEVIKLWEGLGYYSRARNIHFASKQILKEWKVGSQINWNQSLEQWKKLKGVGPYTAGAVVSIGLNQPAALVDGNIERVYSRLFELKRQKTLSLQSQMLWKLSENFVKTYTGRFNPSQVSQAWMELGALVCTPKNPQCAVCPLKQFCQANLNKTQSSYPEPKARAAIKLINEKRILLVQTQKKISKIYLTPSSRWHKGLWDLPVLSRMDLSQNKKLLTQALCIQTKYTVTHHRIQRKSYLIKEEINFNSEEGKWFSVNDLPPVTAPFSKVFKVYLDSLSP